VSQQAVSQTVAEQERVGYVSRRPAPDDRRKHLVGLTHQGRDAIDASRRARSAMAGEIRASLGA
jgi:MarR family transcriptional regulator, organic hydroperoxide resistance regulator